VVSFLQASLQNRTLFSLLPHACHMPRQSHPLSFD
jgi:hypothetical protein